MKDNKHQSPRIYTYKDKQFNNQFQAVYHAFYDGSKTMLEVSVELGILRANICRYVRSLKQTGKIYIVATKLCKKSGHRAVYYSTNPDFKPEDNQLNLWP